MKKQNLQIAELLIVILIMMGNPLTVAGEYRPQLQRLTSSEAELKSRETLEQETADKAFSMLHTTPTVISGYIAQFLTELSSPAPWLRRTRKLVPKHTLGSRQKLSLLGVNNNGDVFYGDEDDFAKEGQRLVIQKNNIGEGCIDFYLKNGWRLVHIFPIYKHNIFGICVAREHNTGRALGRFDMQNQTVKEIATSYKDKDVIVAINTRSALVENDNGTYWVCGPQRMRLQETDKYAYCSASLDSLSNRVIWRPSSGSMRKRLIKDFDQEETNPVVLMIQSEQGGDTLHYMCQRGNTLITSNNTHRVSNDINTIKVRCHTRENAWQPTMVISHQFSEPTVIKPIALNASNSLALCHVHSPSGSDISYPAVIMVHSGSMIAGTLDEETRRLESLFLSPNGRWIAGERYRGSVLLWEVMGTELHPTCTLEDRIYLDEFNKLYEKAKKMKAQYHLTPEQFDAYTRLLRNPHCCVPQPWRARFLPFKAITSIVATEITRDPAGIVMDYLRK